MSKKRAQKREFNAAVELAAAKKARRGIALFALSSTVIAIASAIVAAERVMSSMSTDEDWSSFDWSMDDEDII
ncbi:MAG: hypothetical protein KBS68_01060 [Clostridiales bacterium]|nr:hypothetical protein [Candidatus Crickella merdequi]